ncbi:Guanine nucleotide exchange factor subunit Rich [Cryptotermes secundus]|uniref:Protein RIC1 homolog n=1 Tax=Cryptotermes secundus TaxID=105785 RepID=A0A2J7PZN6_9NEOP|nr:guanine nucleotide exchange factor subunit Rich isoform X3 [Cryptotermes secundus]PNF21795.1 Guanine nucleotide exchange factor subunit Rich [Cryptotermes secundus]
MYFPVGWPKVLNIPQLGHCSIRQVICNRDKILFAILTDDCLSVWFCKPCVPIVIHRRACESIEDIGMNELVEWRPDSSMLVVATSGGYLLLYKLGVVAEQKGLYEQVDSPHPNLRRDSAELFIKEVIPPLHLTLDEEVGIEGGITSMVCIRDELMLATTRGHVLRYRWDGSQNRDYCLDLRRVPFCIDQQVSKAIPILESNTYIVDIEYSPLVGGFAVVLNDGRAAFLTAASLRFDPNQVQGIWAQNIEDATCASVNHKYRLIAFGRKNSQAVVYCIDESTGGLEVSHHIVLSSKDYPGSPGHVQGIRWTPDGCAMAVSWEQGGLSLWSTFGALLMCTLGWDYGLHVDLVRYNPLHIRSMEWSAEGYQLWMVKRQPDHDPGGNSSLDCVIQLEFVKSALTVNPCMSHQSHLYLQGEDRMYVNLGDNLTKVYHERPRDQLSSLYGSDDMFRDVGNLIVTSMLTGSKQWTVVPIPSAYSGTNWPIRYTAIDSEGQNLAVAGRTGLAHYSMLSRKWKLFGNETQEKDFVVTGGLLWWRDHVVMGCYSILENRDEIRIYPRDTRLDNMFVKMARVSAQVLLLNTLRDRLITFCANGQISIYSLSMKENHSLGGVEVGILQSVDISALCVHPACVVSVTLTTLRTETGRHASKEVESIMLNVSGRLLMVQREQNCREGDDNSDGNVFQSYTCAPPTVLASRVENVWVPRKSRREKPHLTESLWLFCGAHGMMVWLPLFPRDGDKSHSFMSKRIMLPFHLRIYPLAILFEDAILLGAENDTTLYTSDSNSPFSLPFCVLERTSQVYLHQILRQLIRRNLGFHAWEIARSCTSLPYFPHSLELLLHEVLEEEATSKEPIPDALLPSVIEFIQEFPVYLQTVVQCARKTEIALWPYLFSAAGKPKDLFQECLARKQLDTAASYLIILQNLEPSSVSRQYATLLLDAALDHCKWELSKDLVRFLRAIDPNDVESPRASFILPSKYGVNPQTPPISPNEEDLSLVLGTMQVSRGRSYSTTTSPKVQQIESGAPSVTGHHRDALRSTSSSGECSKSVPLRRKKSVPTGRGDTREPSGSAEEFFIDVILQRHARRLLSAHRLTDLGHFAAHLDFHLVAWLGRERDRAARVDDFVAALKQLHSDFMWPYPVLCHPVSYYLQWKNSASVDVVSPDANGRSRVGDSGYMSYAGGQRETVHSSAVPAPAVAGSSHYTASVSMTSEFRSSSIVEAQLMPHLLQADESSMMSEESSFWGDEREQYMPDASENRWSDVPSTLVLEQLSQELANKGSPKSEVKLRYLLQLFMEASCLEWALLISILLQDAMAVFRTTNAARSSDHSVEAILRLKDGLVALCHWSGTECLGYKPFTVAIQNEVAVLNKLLSSKQQQQQNTLSSSSSPRLSRSRRTSSNQDGGNQSSNGQMAFGSSNLSTVECDGRLPEGTASQDRPSIGSKNTDETDIGFEGNLGNGSDRISERNGADEMRDQTVMEAAREQAIESTGCAIS